MSAWRRFALWLVMCVLVGFCTLLPFGVALLAGATMEQAGLIWLGGMLSGVMFMTYGVMKYED